MNFKHCFRRVKIPVSIQSNESEIAGKYFRIVYIIVLIYQSINLEEPKKVIATVYSEKTIYKFI